MQKRVSVVIAEEAWEVIRAYQEKKKINTRDEAVERLLLEFGGK